MLLLSTGVDDVDRAMRPINYIGLPLRYVEGDRFGIEERIARRTFCIHGEKRMTDEDQSARESDQAALRTIQGMSSESRKAKAREIIHFDF